MSWLELDDRILEHPKFIRAVKLAGSDAVHLWLGLRAYCGQLLTDGLIPEDMVSEVRGPKEPRRRAAALDALLEVRLLDRTSTGVSMHDFLDWSSSREDVLARRESARDRQRRSRGGSRSVTRDIDVTSPSVTNPRARGSDPLLSDHHSEPLQTKPEEPVDLCQLRPGPVTGAALQRLFGAIRSRDVGGLEWQSVRVSGGAASTMADAINADPSLREDVAPTIALLFKRAKTGAAGGRSADILREPSFAFGAWCSQWTSLREEVRGVTPKVPDAAMPRGPETFADRDARMARERAERDRRSTERAVAATTEKLERDRSFTPMTPEQQEEIRRGLAAGLAELAEKKAVA